MLRWIGGVIAALIAWIVIVTLLNFGLRYGFPGYAAVEKAMTFTIPMMIARLAISATSSLASGWVAALVGRRRFQPALGAGLILLVLFLPVHYNIWHMFPIWYHLTFLLSLPLLSVLGAALRRPKRGLPAGTPPATV